MEVALAGSLALGLALGWLGYFRGREYFTKFRFSKLVDISLLALITFVSPWEPGLYWVAFGGMAALDLIYDPLFVWWANRFVEVTRRAEPFQNPALETESQKLNREMKTMNPNFKIERHREKIIARGSDRIRPVDLFSTVLWGSIFWAVFQAVGFLVW